LDAYAYLFENTRLVVFKFKKHQFVHIKGKARHSRVNYFLMFIMAVRYCELLSIEVNKYLESIERRVVIVTPMRLNIAYNRSILLIKVNAFIHRGFYSSFIMYDAN
jgi:hypothetical protein